MTNTKMNSGTDSGASVVPAFLNKLWFLVEEPSVDDLICWDLGGKSFHVYDQARFAKEILPLYFKHSNMSSFVRQLNMYGFRKVADQTGVIKHEKDDMEFTHPYFVKGKEDLLDMIKRKVHGSVKTDEVKLKQEHVSKVLTDVKQMNGRQERMNGRLDVLKRENEALWREIADLRQKHIKQQQIVNKLIQFLVTLCRNSNREVGMKRKLPMLEHASPPKPNKVPKYSRQFSLTDLEPDYDAETTDEPNFETFDLIETASTAAGLPTDITNIQDDATLTTESSNALVPNDDTPLINSRPPLVKPSISIQDDVTEELDLLQTDLDSLKDVLVGGINMDTNTLFGLFNPDIPLSMPDNLVSYLSVKQMLETLVDGDMPTTSSNDTGPGIIVGNELIQYTAPEDTPGFLDLPLDDAHLLPLSDDNELDSDSDILTTPNIRSNMMPSLTKSKVTTEEVD